MTFMLNDIEVIVYYTKLLYNNLPNVKINPCTLCLHAYIMSTCLHYAYIHDKIFFVYLFLYLFMPL